MLAAHFPHLSEWKAGEVQPALRLLERCAQASNAPLGFFFLPAPPEKAIPIPYFRTMGRGVPRLSADLLDVIYTCQTRQDEATDRALKRLAKHFKVSSLVVQ